MRYLVVIYTATPPILIALLYVAAFAGHLSLWRFSKKDPGRWRLAMSGSTGTVYHLLLAFSTILPVAAYTWLQIFPDVAGTLQAQAVFRMSNTWIPLMHLTAIIYTWGAYRVIRGRKSDA